MTREKAIEWIKFHIDITPYEDTDELKIALDMAIKALEQEPSYNSVESKLKNPKAKTFDILHFVADNAGLSTFEAIEKAYHMGVSEQEPILDKIRAEIEMEKLEDSSNFCVKAHNNAVDRILQIIDKYKAETEDQDGQTGN